jgi:nucleotide-binding universal stress UspA family protein
MMARLRRVLVSVQFDGASTTAVDYAAALAERFQAELHLLHVLEGAVEPDVAALPPDEALAATGAEESLWAGVIPPEWEERLSCHKAMVFGVPWVEINRYAWEHNIDVIVIGASRRSAWRRWLLGSTSDQVVHHAPCPVFLIPYPVRQFPLP